MAKFDPDEYLKEKGEAEVVSSGFDPDAYLAEDLSGLGQAGLFARSAAEGASLGLSEPVISGAKALGAEAFEALMSEDKDFSIEGLKKKFQEDRKQREAEEAAFPKLAMAGEITGAVAPALLSGGASLLGKLGIKGAQTAAGLAKGAQALDVGSKLGAASVKAASALPGAAKVGQVVEKAGRIGQMAKGAASAVTSALPQIAAERGVESFTGFDEGESVDLGDAAMFSAGLGALPGALGAAGDTIGAGYRTLIGLSKEDLAKYAEDPAAFEKIIAEQRGPKGPLGEDAVPTTQREVYDEIMGVSKRVDDKVAAASQEVMDSKINFRSQVKDTLSAAKKGVEVSKAELDAAQKKVEDIYKRAKAPIEIADSIVEANDKARQMLSDASSESYRILEAAQGTIDVAPIVKKGRQIESSLETVDSATQAARKDVEKHVNQIERFGSEGPIPLPRAKVLIQSIDKDLEEYMRPMSGLFNPTGHEELLKVRRLLDEILKTNPDYAAQMERVNQIREVVTESTKMFPKVDTAQIKLAAIAGTGKTEAIKAIRGLSALVGEDLATPVSEYITIAKTSKDPAALQAIVEKMTAPKMAQLSEAEQFLSQAQDILTRNPQLTGAMDQIGQEIAALSSKAPAVMGGFSKEADILGKTIGELQYGQSRLGEAQALAEKIAPFSPGRVQASMSSYISRGSNKYAVSDALAEVSKLAGKDFEATLDMIATSKRLSQTLPPTGYLPTVLQSVGAAIGAFLAGPLGASMGGVLNAGSGLLRTYGSDVARLYVRSMANMKAIPVYKDAAAFINSLPPQERMIAKNQFIRGITQQWGEGMVAIDPSDIAEVEGQIKSSGSLSSIEKAKALKSLNETGEINSVIIKSMQLDGLEKGDRVEKKDLSPLYKN
jgi:hypothetical protein